MDDGNQQHGTDEGLRDRMRRLRWRLSGAWGLPTFVLATVAGTGGVVLLPLAGQQSNVVGAFLLCGFANLFVLAVLAPGAGWILRRRRPQLPRAVAVDRAGTGLMVALLGVLLAIGITHHGAKVASDAADRRQLAAVRRYLHDQADGQYRANIGHESVWKQSDGLYRTCVPGRDPQKNLCLYVDMAGPYPAISVDPDQQPNSVVAGPDNPGRHGR
jgi:hypothetical protein